MMSSGVDENYVMSTQPPTTFINQHNYNANDMTSTKLCIRCNRMLPISHFHKNKYRPDGYRVYCKDCVSEYGKQYRATPAGVFHGLEGRQRFYRKERPTCSKPFSITKEWFIPWYKSQPKECHYCGLKEEDIPKMHDSNLDKVGRLTVDCKDNTLGYVPDNVVLSCLRCNFTKSDFFTYDEWMEIAQKYIKPKWEKRLNASNISTKMEGEE